MQLCVQLFFPSCVYKASLVWRFFPFSLLIIWVKRHRCLFIYIFNHPWNIGNGPRCIAVFSWSSPDVSMEHVRRLFPTWILRDWAKRSSYVLSMVSHPPIINICAICISTFIRSFPGVSMEQVRRPFLLCLLTNWATCRRWILCTKEHANVHKVYCIRISLLSKFAL